MTEVLTVSQLSGCVPVVTISLTLPRLGPYPGADDQRSQACLLKVLIKYHPKNSGDFHSMCKSWLTRLYFYPRFPAMPPCPPRFCQYDRRHIF